MFNRKAAALSFAVLLASTPTWAGESIAEEIARANEQIALLSAKFKELEIRAQIATKQAEIDRITSAGGSVAGNQPAELPVVKGIEGVDGRLTATLAFAGRIQQTVLTGEKIRGGWTVSQIDVSAVTLSRGSERLRLGFGSEPPAAAPSQSGYPSQVPAFR